MKRYIVLGYCLVMCTMVWAQTDPQIGQYMFMQSTYNPAAAGEGDQMRAAGLHRMHFTGMRDMPMTTYFTFASPFAIGKTKHGVGVRFLNDIYGLFRNQTFYVQYAYRQKIGNGELAVGVDLGFANVSFKTDKSNLDSIANLNTDEGYHQGNDPALPEKGGNDGASGMNFDMGVGIYYSAPRWWASASYGHLTQPKIEWSDKSYMRMRGTLYLGGGYNWRMRNRDWVLRPSVMAMTDFASWDVNLTMLAEVKSRYRFGAGYRLLGSVNILLGVEIVSGLNIGYTYELPANSLIRGSYGSHELYLAYGLDIMKQKRTNRYKSIRYL